MTTIQEWMQSPLALAVAKTLLHSLWQSVIVAFVLAVVLRFVHLSRFRYSAACIALVVVVAMSLGTFLLLVPSATDRSQLQNFYPELVVPDPDSANGRTGDLGGFTLQRALPWITPIWLIGVLSFSAKQIGGCVAANRMRRRGVSPAPDVWQQRLDAIRQSLNIARPVVLLESCLTQVPLVVGHLRPAILTPVGLLAGLTAEQVELILIHELAHIRRLDYVINMLQSLVEDAMFYNAAVWWISKTIRIEREHCCDDIAVNATHNPYLYASTLAALEVDRSSREQHAIAATGGSLVKRIRRILHQPEPASPIAPLVAAGVAIFMIAGFVAAHPALPGEEKAAAQIRQNPSPLFPQAALGVYKSWLDKEVTYIITEEERTAFLGLRTETERQAFIEQFWRRRDPTPGTIENEFRDEHRRRIEYVNSHFSSRLPSGFGWKTDRGRTYIQFGPPDELESHSAGGYVRLDGVVQPFPNEFWLYRHLEGIGDNVLIEFIDQERNGEYPRAVDPRVKQQLIDATGRK